MDIEAKRQVRKMHSINRISLHLMMAMLAISHLIIDIVAVTYYSNKSLSTINRVVFQAIMLVFLIFLYAVLQLIMGIMISAKKYPFHILRSMNDLYRKQSSTSDYIKVLFGYSIFALAINCILAVALYANNGIGILYSLQNIPIIMTAMAIFVCLYVCYEKFLPCIVMKIIDKKLLFLTSPDLFIKAMLSSSVDSTTKEILDYYEDAVEKQKSERKLDRLNSVFSNVTSLEISKYIPVIALSKSKEFLCAKFYLFLRKCVDDIAALNRKRALYYSKKEKSASKKTYELENINLSIDKLICEFDSIIYHMISEVSGSHSQFSERFKRSLAQYNYKCQTMNIHNCDLNKLQLYKKDKIKNKLRELLSLPSAIDYNCEQLLQKITEAFNDSIYLYSLWFFKFINDEYALITQELFNIGDNLDYSSISSFVLSYQITPAFYNAYNVLYNTAKEQFEKYQSFSYQSNNDKGIYAENYGKILYSKDLLRKVDELIMEMMKNSASNNDAFRIDIDSAIDENLHSVIPPVSQNPTLVPNTYFITMDKPLYDDFIEKVYIQDIKDIFYSSLPYSCDDKLKLFCASIAYEIVNITRYKYEKVSQPTQWSDYVAAKISHFRHDSHNECVFEFAPSTVNLSDSLLGGSSLGQLRNQSSPILQNDIILRPSVYPCLQGCWYMLSKHYDDPLPKKYDNELFETSATEEGDISLQENENDYQSEWDDEQEIQPILHSISMSAMV